MADAKGDGKIDYLGTDLYHRFYPLVWIGILAAAFFSVWSQISRKVSKINCFLYSVSDALLLHVSRR